MVVPAASGWSSKCLGSICSHGGWSGNSCCIGSGWSSNCCLHDCCLRDWSHDCCLRDWSSSCIDWSCFDNSWGGHCVAGAEHLRSSNCCSTERFNSCVHC